MSSRHTPGPWRVEGTRGDGFIISAGMNVERDGPADYVCVVDPMFVGAPKEADVRLITAAPDLLAAAKGVVAQWDTPNWKLNQSTASVIATLRAAIAQAEPIDPRDPDPSREGIFRNHDCAGCSSGARPCREGKTGGAGCSRPRARND